MYGYAPSLPQPIPNVSRRKSIDRIHNVVVNYDFETNELEVLTSSILVRKSSPSQSQQQAVTIKNLRHNENEPDDGDDDDDGGHCEPMHKWQTHSFPLCNPIHELNIAEKMVDGGFSLLVCGSKRCAFQIREGEGYVPLTLKLPIQRKENFGHSSYVANTMDTMVMERLTKSPYVVSTYGCCGITQVVEYAQGGSLYDLVERLRGAKGFEPALDMSSVDRLRVAIQVITALADLHGFEKDGVASVSHNDFDTDQLLLIDGVYKLNDFNLAYLLKRDGNTKEVCRNYMRVNSSLRKVHAPEETHDRRVDNAKADDYVAGNVMYYILTNKWIFEGVGNKKSVELLRQGKRSPFPDNIKNSKDPAVQALMKGIKMLWTHNVEERPSARMVSDYLIEELEKITGSKEADGVVRVSVPPLPDDWDFEEDGESWDENMDDDN